MGGTGCDGDGAGSGIVAAAGGSWKGGAFVGVRNALQQGVNVFPPGATLVIRRGGEVNELTVSGADRNGPRFRYQSGRLFSGRTGVQRPGQILGLVGAMEAMWGGSRNYTFEVRK